MNSTATITHAAGGATGDEKDFALAGAVNFSATAGDTLTLVYDGTVWREIARGRHIELGNYKTKAHLLKSCPKSPILPIPMRAFSFVTSDQIVQHYGVNAVTDLPTLQQARYNNYATLSNRAIEGAIYKYIDELPLQSTDELRTYLQGMSLHYAILLKQADDGANNVTALDKIVQDVEARIIKVAQSQPKTATTRSMVSNGYPDTVIPYSQSYGLSDIL